MNITRLTLSSILVWVLIFCLFTLMSFLPTINNSTILQGLFIGVFLIPCALLGAYIYYRTGSKLNGFRIGIFMAAIALILDALITVPLVVIPHQGSYFEFYTDPLLWFLIVEYITIIFVYQKVRIKEASTL